MSSTAFPDFDEIATVAWRLGSMLSPSQLQGFLIGQLAVGGSVSTESWLEQATQQIDGVEPPAPEEQQLLVDMLSACQDLVIEGNLDVQLMLPDDEADLSQRVECLGFWCQGFLSGFAAAGKEKQANKGQQQYTAVVSEALGDIAAIAQIGLSDADEGEQSEGDFFEVLEYVRLAAMNIYLECVAPAADKPKATEAKSGSQTPADLFSKKLH